MTTFTPLREVESLWFGCEDVQSRQYDWSRNYENFQAYEAEHLDCESEVECEQCDGGQVDQHDGTTIQCDVCEGTGQTKCDFEGYAVASAGLVTCPRCDHEEEVYSDGPMMNYFWALPEHSSFDKDDALKLEGLPLCLVNFNPGWTEDVDESLPEWALALTGGGMDLSWDICEAFCRLGFLPPLVACRLPRVAGMDYSDPTRQWVIAACKRSYEATRNHAQGGMDYLDSLTDTE